MVTVVPEEKPQGTGMAPPERTVCAQNVPQSSSLRIGTGQNPYRASTLHSPRAFPGPAGVAEGEPPKVGKPHKPGGPGGSLRS